MKCTKYKILLDINTTELLINNNLFKHCLTWSYRSSPDLLHMGPMNNMPADI